jgi:hypothetical protein
MIFHQTYRFIVLACVASSLFGCSRIRDVGFDTKQAIGSVSLVDRCSDFMHRAFPQAEIEATGNHLETEAGNATIKVEAVREDVPENATFARNIEAECRFESGVLTSFRWTMGPIRAAGTAATP